jgi:zinc protease
MNSSLDRSQPPIAGPLTHRPLPPYRSLSLSNGIPVYALQHGSVEVAEIQVVFKAGTAHQSKIGQARHAASLLSEGTASFNSQALAEKLDDHGSWISHDTAYEFSSINLTSLEQHLPATLPLLQEVLLQPTFPEEEFEIMRARGLQKLEVEAKRKTYIARKAFGHLLYGKDHPYGQSMGPEDLKALQVSDLQAFYKQFLQAGNCFFTVVGRFDEEAVFQQLDQLFGKLSLTQPQIPESRAATHPVKGGQGRHFIAEAGMQSALSLGHLGFARKHPDYYPMELVNTLLGGYFGSRLMKNIREDKGYTYGIYSGWVAHKHGGYFVVQSQVGNEYAASTIREVRKEMQRLRDEPVSEAELDLVKNYILGKSISRRETPFQLGSLLRYALVNDINFEELDSKFNRLNELTPAEVQRLAQDHLRPDELLEVVCGEQVEAS